MSSKPIPITRTAERSQSRGREPLISSGRGGAGNIRPASGSRDPGSRDPGSRDPALRRQISGPDDYSPTRGRELADRRDETTTTGRGGAGNLRSPSRHARAATEEAIKQEARYMKALEAGRSDQIISTGRGGAGNMSRSRSRSRDPASPNAPSSTGRGGFGNLTNGGRPSVDLSKLDEEEKKTVEREGVPHGVTNQAAGQLPTQERQHIQHNLPAYIACGRGGAGNIHTAAY